MNAEEPKVPGAGYQPRSFGIQEFTQAIPDAETLARLRAARTLHRDAAKRLARTIGISWLQVRRSDSNTK